MKFLGIVFVWSQLDGGKVEQKNNGISSHQNLMMPQLNEWAETSPNPSAKADPTIVYITPVIVPCNLVIYDAKAK